jgi:hypothetical protein
MPEITVHRTIAHHANRAARNVRDGVLSMIPFRPHYYRFRRWVQK